MGRKLLGWLASFWLGMALLAALTLACIYGSVVSSDASRGLDYALVHVFHTWWFLGLMALLGLNLALCTWRRSFRLLRLSKRPALVTDKRFFEQSRHHAVLEWPVPQLDQLHDILRSHFPVVHTAGNAAYARKGLIGRYGATIVHLGLLWVMAAGLCRIVAEDWGWGVYDATAVISEGSATNEYFTRIDRLKEPTQDNLRYGKLPFTLRLLDFRAEYHPQTSVPKYFASLVELQDGSHSEIHEINMTTPLVYKGYKVTQNSYGSDPRTLRGRFRVSDTRSGVFELVDASAGHPVKLHLPNSQNLFLQVSGLAPNKEFAILDLAAGKRVAGGQTADAAAPKDSRTPYQVVYLDTQPGQVTYLGVMRDPSTALVFSGCLVLVLGTLIAFTVSHRELWCLYCPQQGKLLVAWSIKGSAPPVRQESERVLAELKRLAFSQSEPPVYQANNPSHTG